MALIGVEHSTAPGHRPMRSSSAAASLPGAAWILNEAARGPYNTLINVFIFSTYFTTVVIRNPVEGQVIWSTIAAIGALIGIVGAPILGSFADAGGRCKPWLAGFTLLGIPSMAVLWLATPGMQAGLWLVVAGLLGSMIFFEYAPVFANALLPRVAPRRDFGIMSGYAISAANIATIILLLFFLFAWSWTDRPLFGLDAAKFEPQRAVGPLSALWLAVFSLPVFLFAPDGQATGVRMGTAVRTGLRRYRATFGTLRKHPQAARFLIARIIYNEGMVGLMMFAAVYAAGVMKWTPMMILISGLASSVLAIASGVVAGWLDRRVGSRNATLVFIACGMFATVLLCSISRSTFLFVPIENVAGASFSFIEDQAFLVGMLIAAFGVSGCFASSRALMAKLTPQGMENQFFGLYALSGLSTSFIAPAAIGVITYVSESQRAGLSVGIVFLLIGGIFLARIRLVPGQDEEADGPNPVKPGVASSSAVA